MTVARARTRSGARTGLRIALCGVTAVLALFATACGNNTIDLGTPVITLTDTSGDFTSYIVTIDGIQVTRSDGSIQPLLSAQERVDFTQLSNIVDLLQAPAAVTGTYVSLTMTVDYSTASITVNKNGQSVPVSLIDTAGAVPTVVTWTVKFDPANPLVITKGKSSLVALDFDLATSNSFDINASPVVVTVKPFTVVNAKPVYNKPIRARGLFVDADTNAGTFALNTRPLNDLTGITYGALHLKTDASTYYNINGVTYTGSAGLAAVAKLRENVQIGVVGSPTAFTDLTGITPVFAATAVYAGTSLESLIADRVSGVVTGRVGDTISLRNASIVTRAGGVFFADGCGRMRGRVIGQVRKLRRALVVLDGNPVFQIGKIACIGQPIGQRGLVDQEPGAAIGQHIGDFRLLLPGAEYHRHGAEMRGTQHRQHELDAIAEQERDAVAALQAHFS